MPPSKPRPSRQRPTFRELKIEEYVLTQEPFYLPQADEIELFEAAYANRIPVLLKGPTGCGKTRFVEHMAYRLGKPLSVVKPAGKNDEGNGRPKVAAVRNTKLTPRTTPLITIACHEDLTASDLVGRYLIEGEGTRWIDGPLTLAVRTGGICYLDEIVEARKDTTVLIHPLTDHRRILPIEKRGLLLEADPGFLLCISYNPGYQSALKDLKHSTRQRFIAIDFGYPPKEIEAAIIKHEAQVSEDKAWQLAKLAEKVRNLTEHGLQEGASTRLLIYAAKLIAHGIPPRRACQVAIVWAVTDDHQVQQSVEEIVSSIFE
jgi:nitric oxide reductase NorQ protein